MAGAFLFVVGSSVDGVTPDKLHLVLDNIRVSSCVCWFNGENFLDILEVCSNTFCLTGDLFLIIVGLKVG